MRAWLFRIAKNVMLEAIRAGQRGGTGSSAAGPTTKLFALENAPDTATAVSRQPPARAGRGRGRVLGERFLVARET